MPEIKTVSLQPKMKPLPDEQRKIYDLILDSDIIHRYNTADGIMNVCRFNQYVYVHYLFAQDQQCLIIIWRLSHSLNHIDIPLPEK